MIDVERAPMPSGASVSHDAHSPRDRANLARIALADYWLPRGLSRQSDRPRAVDWTPARRDWPGELRDLHAVCVAAALAWRQSIQAQDRALTAGAACDPALGDVSVTLALLVLMLTGVLPPVAP